VIAAQIIADTFRQAAYGPELAFQNLAVVPILGGRDRGADYATLDEALASGSAEVTEVSDGGRVPELKIIVKGATPVLLVDGEELIGAKQNRVLNLTILVPPEQTTVIPVSCVEAGRWHHVSRGFASAPRAQFAEGRAAKMRQVTASLLSVGERRSDQQAVWKLIAEKSARLEALSDTSAMSAVFEKVEPSLDDFVRALTPIDGQVGAVFLIDRVPVGLELFDAAATWRKLAPKLVRSYAVDAIDRRRRRARRSSGHDAAAFVQEIASSAASVLAATGEGEDVRISGPGVTGAALVARGRAIHISAFAVTEQ
jgi:hypothetical protein